MNNPFQPTTYEQSWDLAQNLAKSNVVPKKYKGMPLDIWVVISKGFAFGFDPIQSLEAFYYNDGLCIYGDAAKAVVLRSAKCEYIKQSYDPETKTATCIAKRLGHPERVITFSYDDAVKAGWASKQNWKSMPQRMIETKALTFAIKDKFSDLLLGVNIYEDTLDYKDASIEVKAESPIKKIVDNSNKTVTQDLASHALKTKLKYLINYGLSESYENLVEKHDGGLSLTKELAIKTYNDSMTKFINACLNKVGVNRYGQHIIYSSIFEDNYASAECEIADHRHLCNVFRKKAPPEFSALNIKEFSNLELKVFIEIFEQIEDKQKKSQINFYANQVEDALKE